VKRRDEKTMIVPLQRGTGLPAIIGDMANKAITEAAIIGIGYI